MKENIEGQYRQGDVLIMEGKESPDTGEFIARDNGRVVLAYGEVTGHAHAIVSDGAKHYRSKTSVLKTYLSLVEPVMLRHEEHREIPIKEKFKEVRIQRQWSTERIKQVQD